MFDEQEKFMELMEKYAHDMSSMCQIITNLLDIGFTKEVQDMKRDKAQAKLLCLVHKALLESTDIGIQTRNGNPLASEGLANIINNMARNIGLISKKSIVEFEHADISGGKNFQSILTVKTKKKNSEDSVDIDTMIKNAGLTKGGAEA